MFVIYKENIIPGVGGIHPDGIEVGLAQYNGWNLADCPIDKMHNYKEYNFVAVSKDVANGLKILDTLVDEDDGSPEGEQTNFILSDKDKLDVELAKKFINNLELKIITRAKVREVKDVEDDLVDLKRLVQSLVGFVVEDWSVKSKEEQEQSIYKDVFKSLKETLSENRDYLTFLDTDLRKIERIIDQEVEISNIVDNYYLTKKLK